MSLRFALIIGSLLAAAPSPGLDISGYIINKSDQPIPLAQICLRNNPSRCVASTVSGSFRITDGSGVERTSPRRSWSVEILDGRMALGAPAAARARLDWHDAGGRALAPSRIADLGAGRNLLDLPALPRDGIHFLRITTADFSATWKAVLLGSLGGATATRGAGSAPAALSKPSAVPAASAITDLMITKTGFRPATYRPFTEVENDAVVVLTAQVDSGFVFTSTFKAKNTIDRAKGEWITETTVDTCDGLTPVKAVFKDTSRFAVRDGKLYQWYPGQCVGEVLTGGGAEVVGAWTLSESDAFLPQDLRAATCKDTILSNPVPPTVKGKLTVTETEQSFELTEEVCPPDGYLPLIAVFLLQDTTIELVGNTCRKLVFTNGAAEQATMSFAKRGDSLATTFTYLTTTCVGVEMMRQGDGVAINCTEDDPVFTLLECIAATGYFGDVPPVGASPLAKASSLPSRLSVPARPAWTGTPPASTRPSKSRSTSRSAPERGIFPYHGRGPFPPR